MPSAGDLRSALTVFGAGKIFAVAFLLAGLWLHPVAQYPGNLLFIGQEQVGSLIAFVHWDGHHYLHLASNGYPLPPTETSGFYPLFPALIALAMWSGLGPVGAGIAVATLCSLGAVLMLERLLPREERGPSSLWLLVSFPTAFYLSVIYTEALFLAALFGLLWALRDAERARWALLCAAALPLTRGQGLWLAVALAAAWLAPALGIAGQHARRSLAAATLGYLLGAAAYLCVFWWYYGDPFLGFKAMGLFISGNSVANLFDLPRFVDLMFSPPNAFLDLRRSGLDKTMAALMLLALAFGVARGVRDPFLLAAWACFALLPAMMGELTAYARYALIAWACFVPSVGPTLRPATKWALIVPGFALQAYLAFHFGGNRWVG